MTQYGTWRAYAGLPAWLLAAALLAIAGVLACLGTRLRRPLGVERPGRTVSILLVVIWMLSFLTFGIAISVYGQALFDQVGNLKLPNSPVAPVTLLSGLAAFILIALLGRRHGLKVALGSAIAGTIAAPMIFELPYDLVVMWRTYGPTPFVQYTLLFFLPLFLWEVSSFSLLTLSPLTRISKPTVFSLAAVFFLFAVWALFGFSYPSTPIPFALNAASKVLCFVTAVTLFLPHREQP